MIKGGGGGISNDHTRSQWGRGGVQEGPKTDHEILEQPLTAADISPEIEEYNVFGK